MSTRQIFITNLKYFRKQKGYTQAQLATLIDKSFNYINGIECGLSFPPPDVIDKIAEILKIRPIQLFDENSCADAVFQTNKEAVVKSVSEHIYNKLKTDIRTFIIEGIEKAVGEI
ncbi:MAG: helix-turn-helix domain-containing protein [Treponema sp.]